jgi:hypothetical protein
VLLAAALVVAFALSLSWVWVLLSLLVQSANAIMSAALVVLFLARGLPEHPMPPQTDSASIQRPSRRI